MVQYIKENLHASITVEQLAKLACMSKPHFFRSSKMKSSVSPIEFIHQGRLAPAKQYLADSRLSVADAAYKAGFNDLPYVMHVFKKAEGTIPGAYRQKSFL